MPSHIPIPVTVVGGFLGAGKSSAIHAMLADTGGRRIGVLVNDFGALALDAALIAQRNATTVALTNGCICCSLVSGLTQALIDMLALEPRPDHIVIEASGISDPRRIADFAYADSDLLLDAIVVMVAADQWNTLCSDPYIGETLKVQVASADLVVQNKLDLVDTATAIRQRAFLAALAPNARIIATTHAHVPVDVLLGGMPATINRQRYSQTTLTSAAITSPAHTHFASRYLSCDRPVDGVRLRDALDELPHAVLRVKGLIRLDEVPDEVMLLQVVGRRWALTPFPGNAPSGSHLALIGTATALGGANLASLEALFADPETKSLTYKLKS